MLGFLSDPDWYKMLPDNVKPMSRAQKKAVNIFQAQVGWSDDTMAEAVLQSRWAVGAIQHKIYREAKLDSPGRTETQIWTKVLMSRLQACVIGATTSAQMGFESSEVVMRRIDIYEEALDPNKAEQFSSFQEVVDHIISADESVGMFNDPTGLRVQLDLLLSNEI